MRKNNPGSLYGSFCEGYGCFWLLLGKISEELSGETLEKVTSRDQARRILTWCLWVVVTYNEIHNYIYEYIWTYRPTFSVTSTRESKNQIGMALPYAIQS